LPTDVHELALAGSELGGAVVDAGDVLRLRLAAARVAGGWLQGLELSLAGASPTEAMARACIGRIAEGRVRVDGHERRLAVPCELAGDVVLELCMAGGATLLARGRALALAPRGPTRFFDDYSC